jgi:hypothetical protein
MIDPHEQDPDAIIADAQNVHPVTLYVLTSKLMAVGRLEEMVQWYYVAQLRLHYYILSNPDDASNARVLFSALTESVGRPVNEYAYGDVDAAVRQIRAALAWDAAHPNGVTPKHASPEQLTDLRAALEAQCEDMLARKDEIRETRSRNGLENR